MLNLGRRLAAALVVVFCLFQGEFARAGINTCMTVSPAYRMLFAPKTQFPVTAPVATPTPAPQLTTAPVGSQPFPSMALEALQNRAIVAYRKSHIAHPEIPGVEVVHLPHTPPLNTAMPSQISGSFTDPLLQEADRLKAVPDLKTLADARRRPLTVQQIMIVEQKARALERAAVQQAQLRGDPQAITKGRVAYLNSWIQDAYDTAPELLPAQVAEAAPKFTLAEGHPLKPAFDQVERMYSVLERKPPPVLHPKSSLVPTPYPMLIAAARFREPYYWDSYVGLKGLLATGRLEMARMQTENLLESVRRFGFVPNGARDYYLTRSQPPVLSSMVRETYEASMREAQKTNNVAEQMRLNDWMVRRALPLLKAEHTYWMAPERMDAMTGLNHNWDDSNVPRPERPAADNEYALGATPRDVRAQAMSGEDFTVTNGHDASHTSTVTVNSLMYKTERDIAWAAGLTGDTATQMAFEARAHQRQQAMNKLMWDPLRGIYENYSHSKQARIPLLSAGTFVPMYVGLASPEQAKSIYENALPALTRAGGLMSTEATGSTKQWDGVNGWPPQQLFAVQGLKNYGYDAAAKDLALRYVKSIANAHKHVGQITERIDVARADVPVNDGTKYDVQPGFQWTNGFFQWALSEVLGVPFRPLP